MFPKSDKPSGQDAGISSARRRIDAMVNRADVQATPRERLHVPARPALSKFQKPV